MSRFALLALLCTAAVLQLTVAAAAPFEKTCDVHQGLDGKKDVRSTYGYVNDLYFAGVDLPADLQVKDARTEAAKSVVGVISSISWSLSRPDPLRVTALVSAANKQALLMAMQAKDGWQFDLNFEVTAFDTFSNKYYTAFQPRRDLANPSVPVGGGVIADRSGVKVAAEASEVSPNQQLYEVTLVLPPSKTISALDIAVNSRGAIPKAWQLTAAR